MATDVASRTPVPFLDLSTASQPVKDAVLADFAELIDANAFINGPQVGAFEEAFARYCGTKLCVGVASGLDALRLGLQAMGVGPGDEVIVPAATFVATFEAVTQTGAKPVVVESRDDDYGLDADAAGAAVTERTRAFMPVHLYGQLVDLRALRDVSERTGVPILEDACQAHGAERDGIRAGTGGVAAAFSFYPGKNLGAFGDAGALVTDDEELAERVRALREHGQRAKYDHAWEGWTARLDTVQAIVLRHKLPLLDGWNEERRTAARFYSAALDGVGDLKLPAVLPDSEPVWHLYVVRTADPQALRDHLATRGVSASFHYPEPPHLSAAYRYLGHGEGSFPVAEALSRECLSLPIFPGMSDEQLQAVVDAVADYFRRG